MLRIRKAEDRGHVQYGWLDTYHTFSFGDYYDPQNMGYHALRVINDDRVVPGAGFPTHGHRDMEIITVVLEGALEHKDSLGTGSIIRPGEVQRMSAGKGITHSEFNPSPEERLRLLQIWIQPKSLGLPPGYEQKSFPLQQTGRLHLVASPDGRDGSVTIHQDASLYWGRLADGEIATVSLSRDRYGWVQVANGRLTLNGMALREGDGVAVADEDKLEFVADGFGEVLLFDLA
jgi:redox-sensitive bicupin YhaK (pirin superfamily)